jgi:mRNA interferase RelE/StbE
VKWRLLFSDKADKLLEKLDANSSRIIVAWLLKNIDDCENPRAFGKALRADHSGEWRYHVGKYRVLVEIRDDELVVLALSVGHRSSVY